MREFVKQIVASLRYDETWLIEEHWVSNDKLGVKVWIANGWSFTRVVWAAERRSYGGWGDETKIRLTLLEKIAVWRAYKHLRKLKRARIHNTVLESIIERRLTTGEKK